MMLSKEELKRLKKLVDDGKISDNIAFTTEPLEDPLPIPDDDEESVKLTEEMNRKIIERNRLRKRSAQTLRELFQILDEQEQTET